MSAVADRHLLFGLLALQNGIISQVQLVAAFQAWTLDKSRSLADHLAARGDLTGPRRALLEGLVEVHLETHGGDVGQSLAAVSAGKSTRESLARIGDPAINATLGHVPAARLPTEDGDADRTTAHSVGSATSDGQRFRVLRPHARGGLGAVFVALDAELNREVALKQLLDHHADDPTSRHRFLIEAQITGGLEHPGIVPVYGLGTYDGGRPYYAMRFIKGDSLKDAIAAFHADTSLKADPGRRSLELRKLLRRFLDVCNAIAYAHQRGVLHRDLKPGNVMVGKYGETLVVDWGLAKAVGRSDPRTAIGERTLVPSSSSGVAETLAGSVVGTPAYMSPEQAAGDLDRLGPRSDVYSLGAMLYCLLTGKPPFEGDDLGAMLRAVQRGEFPAPRSVDPSIDPALEAVCQKAMAADPEGRYASPRELADDVERWTADEPVSARPEPFPERARRWMRRRRTTVTAAAVALVVATLGLASVLAVQYRANAELATANTRVQARFDLALEAIKTFHSGVSEDVLLKNDNLKPVRDRLLKDAAEFYERLRGQLSGQADRTSRRALGQAYFEMARLAGEIGATDQAIANCRQTLAVRRRLADAADTDGEAQAEVGRSLIYLGELLTEVGQTDEARTSFAEARTLLEGVTRANPAVTQYQSDLASSHHSIGMLLLQTGKPAETLASFEAARAIRQTLADANPTASRFQQALARSHNSIGVLLSRTGKPAEALARYQTARAIQQTLADANPAVADFQRDLANSHNNIGLHLSETGKPAEALASFQAARAIQQTLADANPAVTRFQRDLARIHDNIGQLLSQTGKPAEALAWYQAARAIQQKLADANPAVTGFQSSLATSHNNIGALLNRTGTPGQALASFQAARAIQQKLADANPAVTEFQSDLARSHNNIGTVLHQTGKPGEALASYQAARAIQQTLADANPAVTRIQSALANSHNNIGALLSQAGKPGEGLASYQAAQAIRQKLADANPEQHTYERRHTQQGRIVEHFKVM